MTRLRSFLAALALLMLVAQQGAVMHVYTHVAEARQQRTEQHHSPADSCEQCLAYAGVLGGLPSVAPVIAAADVVPFEAPAVDAAFVAVPLHAYRSRAPPLPFV